MRNVVNGHWLPEFGPDAPHVLKRAKRRKWIATNAAVEVAERWRVPPAASAA